MYFSYFEKGWGELYFAATISPFTLRFSKEITELFYIGLN